MSTRSTISVSDDRDRFDIYRHHDGYPQGEHGVISGLHRARDLAWPSARIQAGEFAAAVVAVMKSGPGSVYLTDHADAHGDRDFHYDLRYADEALQVTVHDFTRRTTEALIRFDGPLDDAVKEFDVGPIESERLATVNQVWEALSSAEAAMADPTVAQRKGIWRDATRQVFAAMDAHRAEKRAASAALPDD